MDNQSTGEALHQDLKKKYLADYNPTSAITTLAGVNTVPDTWRVKTPTLSMMQKDLGPDFVVDFLALWITEMNEMLNISVKMNPTQIYYTARQILAELPLITVAHIKLAYQRIITGYYGKDYNRIDPSTICSVFRMIWEEHFEAAEMDSLQGHYNKKEAPDNIYDMEIAKLVKKFKMKNT